MKKKYLILTFLIFVCGFLFSFQVNAKLLKNPFHKHAKKQSQSASEIPPGSALKARAAYLELEGDSVEYDQESNVYITSGMSTAHIVDQNANLEADKIVYYGSDQHIEAIGNIKITRDNIVSTGESFKFDVT